MKTAHPPYLSPIQVDSLTPAELRTLVAGRKIRIWGGAFVGQSLWRSLTRHGFEVESFLDSSPRFQGRKLRGLPVLPPAEVLSRPGARAENFIVTASGHWDDQLKAACLAAGFGQGRDFISFNDLVPVQPAIEISGVCNLRCQGCPRGNLDEHPAAGFMSAADQARVLDKFLREIPFLGGVQLYTWGEPLLNREFLEILGQTRRRGVLSIVSTNLNVPVEAEQLVTAGADLVRLSASGWGADYKKTHTGGRWSLFLKQVRALAEARRRLAPEMEVELYYHLYRHNRGPGLEKMRALAAECGFVFRPVWGCLYPWDNLMKMHLGQPLSPQAREHLKLLIGDFEAILNEAKTGPEQPCTQVRCFPVNWDLSVLSCGGWYLPRLAENFLATPLAELVRLKMASQTCRQCAALGIHRVNFPFMADRSAED